MSEPLLGLGARYPEKTMILGQVFNDTAASYKYFWLLGLLNLIQRDGKGVFAQREIVEEMVVAAWHPVCFYRLSLGGQDNLQHTVLELKNEAGLGADALPDAILPKVKLTVIARQGLKSLTALVPTRFLSPWFATELRGVDGHVRTNLLYELAAKSQTSSTPSPYYFERIGADTLVRLNKSWAEFLRENAEVIRSFVFFHLCRYLQARNPNVPGIVNKLSAPIVRDLGPARRFWRAVRSEFQRAGKGLLFHDIYAGTALDDTFSIDHFLPWSFVAHDLLWNLAPVTTITNSKKCDALPSLELYLPKLSRLHRESLLIMRDKPKFLEDYANWLRSDIAGIIAMPEEQFHQRFRESIEPQFQIARNQGFQANWSLS